MGLTTPPMESMQVLHETCMVFFPRDKERKKRIMGKRRMKVERRMEEYWMDTEKEIVNDL